MALKTWEKVWVLKEKVKKASSRIFFFFQATFFYSLKIKFIEILLFKNKRAKIKYNNIN